MLYEELIKDSKEYFKKYLENVGKFRNQFDWDNFNLQCYDYFYKNNIHSKDATVKEGKNNISGLKEMCKECGKYFMPARNKSLVKYDVQFGKQIEEELMKFLAKILGTKVDRGDSRNKKYPDCAIYDKNGNVIAYFEVKYHGAPFISAYRLIGRECFEGSATLDYKKIKNQIEIIETEIKVPVYYLHWIDYPCLKGVFYETFEQVREYTEKQHIEFKRAQREGDQEKSSKSRYFSKVYSPLLDMATFEEFVEEINKLL